MGRHRKFRVPKANRRVDTIIGQLKAKRIRSVRFDGQFLTVDFNGKHLRRRVSVGKHVKWCGTHRPGSVLVDDDFSLIEAFEIAVHETVEDHVIPILRRKGFSRADAEAYGHEIAEQASWNWARQHTSLKRGEHARKVERVFRKEMAHAGEI